MRDQSVVGHRAYEGFLVVRDAADAAAFASALAREKRRDRREVEKFRERALPDVALARVRDGAYRNLRARLRAKHILEHPPDGAEDVRHVD